MAASVAISLWLFGPTLPVVSVALGLAGLATWLWRRPEPRGDAPAADGGRRDG